MSAANNIIHGDLNPNNVLLKSSSSAGEENLCVVAAPEDARSGNLTFLPMTHVPQGLVPHKAPESALHGVYRPAMGVGASRSGTCSEGVFGQVPKGYTCKIVSAAGGMGWQRGGMPAGFTWLSAVACLSDLAQMAEAHTARPAPTQ